MSEQLRLDGTAVPIVQSAAKSPLTPAQRAILAFVAEHGVITSTQAGTIIHTQRQASNPHITNSQYVRVMHPYAAADGLAACKRLMKRGLVMRGDKLGRWVRP